MTEADDPTRTIYLALERRLATAGEALSRAELVRWSTNGTASGHGAAVERRLRHMLARGAGGAGFQPFWLRLLGTVVWRRGALPEAVACFREALTRLVAAPPAPDPAPSPPKPLDNAPTLRRCGRRCTRWPAPGCRPSPMPAPCSA